MQHNLGMALVKAGALAEAMPSLEQAVRLEPGSADAWNSLGYTQWQMGQFAEAQASLGRAVQLDPQHAQAHLNRAMLRLLLADFANGWPEYEWRWQAANVSLPPFHRPAWDGTPLAGRTILLHTEQGAGDTIQFVRYATLVKQRGATVFLACPASLVPLLSTCPGIDKVFAKGEALPDFEVHAPLLSLPRLFDTTAATIPRGVPYLSAQPLAALRPDLHRKLGGKRWFKIGIAWQGSRKYGEDASRSVPLARFAPLAAVKGVRLFSLQKGDGIEQLEQVDVDVIDLGRGLDEKTGAFVETAAVVQNLDLVVTADTAVAHLAGALSVPVWVALPHVPNWRWGVDGDDSPWYPSLRLFRQTERGSWEPVFHQIAEALRARIADRGHARPVRVHMAPGELLDRITILQIKAERITDQARLHHVRTELDVLLAARAEAIPESAELARLTAELRKVNEALWGAEDRLRAYERAADFGRDFVEVARSVYQQKATPYCPGFTPVCRGSGSSGKVRRARCRCHRPGQYRPLRSRWFR
jgi:hypothetical protein